VRVDTSIFEESGRELGTGAAISPICINDNLVDVELIPATTLGRRAEIRISPELPCFEFINATRTVEAGKTPTVRFVEAEEASDPAIIVVEGDVPESSPFWMCYCVPHPSRFAQSAFRQSLRDVGVVVERGACEDASFSGVEVAQHTSPPLREAVKVVLKVSQNLHAELLTRVVGASVESDEKPLQAGFRREKTLLEAVGIDASAVAQGDAAGGFGYFSPIAICKLLQYVARQPYGTAFRDALPIMGVDGTLHNIQDRHALVHR
jgi:D-alanyl-D-alanine carboxypeptidase/D-alanyl-D-alanine-endopeptidase (penicillin-binding protein 4)